MFCSSSLHLCAQSGSLILLEAFNDHSRNVEQLISPSYSVLLFSSGSFTSHICVGYSHGSPNGGDNLSCYVPFKAKTHKPCLL
jgi:hypothetical protein